MDSQHKLPRKKETKAAQSLPGQPWCREAGIDELHRISPTPTISCENNRKKKARADAHPCTVR